MHEYCLGCSTLNTYSMKKIPTSLFMLVAILLLLFGMNIRKHEYSRVIYRYSYIATLNLKPIFFSSCSR